MTRSSRLLTPTLLTTALLAAGCGGGDKQASTGTTPVPVPAATTATTAAPPTTPTAGTATNLADDPRVKAAIQRCKDSIDANPQVKDDIKADVKSICDKAASGNPQDVKDAIRQVCEKIVESSLPPGDARDRAKRTCATAGD